MRLPLLASTSHGLEIELRLARSLARPLPATWSRDGTVRCCDGHVRSCEHISFPYQIEWRRALWMHGEWLQMRFRHLEAADTDAGANVMLMSAAGTSFTA
jgi:hypothetical protein